MCIELNAKRRLHSALIFVGACYKLANFEWKCKFCASMPECTILDNLLKMFKPMYMYFHINDFWNILFLELVLLIKIRAVVNERDQG